jgi:hypothetical protein
MQSLAIVLLCVVSAVAYGIAHDLVTAHICVEYFTVAHPRLVASESPVVLALLWGVVATWWVGAILGWLLALAARSGPRPQRDWRSLVRPVVMVNIVAALAATAAGLMGRAFARQGMIVVYDPLFAKIPREHHVAFLTDAWAHTASYLVAFVGGAILVVWTWRSRSRMPRAS